VPLAIEQVSDSNKDEAREFPRGFEGHRRAHAGFGLRLTPVERLRWLEETMATLRRWRGRADRVSRGEE
jgi:hypothetical protein